MWNLLHKLLRAYCSSFGSASKIGSTSSASRPEKICRNLTIIWTWRVRICASGMKTEKFYYIVRVQKWECAHHLCHKQHQSLQLRDWISQIESPSCLLSNARSIITVKFSTYLAQQFINSKDETTTTRTRNSDS